MNKNSWQWIFVLAGSMFMLWFSLAILIVGRQNYGADASLLWASGFLSYLGMRGLSHFLWMLFANEGGEE